MLHLCSIMRLKQFKVPYVFLTQDENRKIYKQIFFEQTFEVLYDIKYLSDISSFILIKNKYLWV